MCKELESNTSGSPLNKAKKINLKYYDSLKKPRKIIPIPHVWIIDMPIPPKEIFTSTDTERLQEILELFEEKSITFFEPLNIWDIPILQQIFIKKTGRKPKPQKIPWHLKLIKNIL
jgi:hypothetical protein